MSKIGDNMLAKISMVLYLIATILHFINSQMTLFWLSIVLGIVVTTGLSFYMSYRQVSPQLKGYQDTVRQMEANGASDDEILEFMDQDTEVDESKFLKAPLWILFSPLLGLEKKHVIC